MVQGQKRDASIVDPKTDAKDRIVGLSFLQALLR